MTKDEARQLELYDLVTYVPSHADEPGHIDADRGVLIEYAHGMGQARVLYSFSRKIQLTPIEFLVKG